jgi:hypothetical protein
MAAREEPRLCRALNDNEKLVRGLTAPRAVVKLAVMLIDEGASALAVKFLTPVDEPSGNAYPAGTAPVKLPLAAFPL